MCISRASGFRILTNKITLEPNVHARWAGSECQFFSGPRCDWKDHFTSSSPFPHRQSEAPGACRGVTGLNDMTYTKAPHAPRTGCVGAIASIDIILSLSRQQ